MVTNIIRFFTIPPNQTLCSMDIGFITKYAIKWLSLNFTETKIIGFWLSFVKVTLEERYLITVKLFVLTDH